MIKEVTTLINLKTTYYNMLCCNGKFLLNHYYCALNLFAYSVIKKCLRDHSVPATGVLMVKHSDNR